MREVSSDPDLAQKPLGTQCRREFRVEDFDSDRTVVPKVCSQVYGGHATAAKRALDQVAVGECGFEVFQALGHRELRWVKQEKLEREWLCPTCAPHEVAGGVGRARPRAHSARGTEQWRGNKTAGADGLDPMSRSDED